MVPFPILSAREMRTGCLLRLGLSPTDLPSYCDGCGQSNSKNHALKCNNGGLMITSHDDINMAFQELAVDAHRLSDVRDEPRTNPGRATRASASPASPAATSVVAPAVANEERADTIVRNFWSTSRDCCFDVTMRNLDADSYWLRDPANVLASAAATKKKKHLRSCLENRRDFTPLVFSRDALIEREADYALKCIARKISKKWEIHYSWVCGYVKARMGLNIIRATTRCLYGSRVPIRLVSCKPDWADGSGMAVWDVLNEHSY